MVGGSESRGSSEKSGSSSSEAGGWSPDTTSRTGDEPRPPGLLFPGRNRLTRMTDVVAGCCQSFFPLLRAFWNKALPHFFNVPRTEILPVPRGLYLDGRPADPEAQAEAERLWKKDGGLAGAMPTCALRHLTDVGHLSRPHDFENILLTPMVYRSGLAALLRHWHYKAVRREIERMWGGPISAGTGRPSAQNRTGSDDIVGGVLEKTRDVATVTRMVNSCAYYIVGGSLLVEHQKCVRVGYKVLGWGRQQAWKMCGVVPQRPRFVSKHFANLKDQIKH